MKVLRPRCGVFAGGFDLRKQLLSQWEYIVPYSSDLADINITFSFPGRKKETRQGTFDSDGRDKYFTFLITARAALVKQMLGESAYRDG